jgi:hypothetical protein
MASSVLTRAQRVLLAIGVVVLVGLLLFPPWVAVSEWADGHADTDPCGRHFILEPPKPPLVVPELRATILARQRAGAALYGAPDRYVVDSARQIIPLSAAASVVLCGLVLLRRRS